MKAESKLETTASEPDKEATKLLKLGTLALEGEYYPDATCYLNQALIRSRTIKAPEIEAQILIQQGFLYDYKSDAELAEINFRKALMLYRKMEDLLGEAEALRCLSNTYLLMDNFSMAMDLRKQSLDLFTKLKLDKETADALADIGRMYYKIDQCEQTLDYLQKALEIYRQLEDLNGLAVQLDYMGLTYFKMDQPLIGLKFITESFEVSERYENSDNLVALLLRLKGYYLREGKDPKEEPFYQRTIKLLEQ